MDIELRVPLVGQQHGYDGRQLMQPNRKGVMKPHGQMACWYASACMVSYYFRPGPRLGLPPVWAADAGLTVQAINALASVEGLTALSKPIGGVTRDFIADTLSRKGPIWAAVRLLNYGHAIVLTGVRGQTLLYNDPWEPAAKLSTVSWLVGHLYNLPNALMVKDIRSS